MNKLQHGAGVATVVVGVDERNVLRRCLWETGEEIREPLQGVGEAMPRGFEMTMVHTRGAEAEILLFRCRIHSGPYRARFRCGG